MLGAIQNKNTCDRVDQVENSKHKVVLSSGVIENPMFKNARIATPVVLEVDATQKEDFSQELFGPIASLWMASRTRSDSGASVALARGIAQGTGTTQEPNRNTSNPNRKRRTPGSGAGTAGALANSWANRPRSVPCLASASAIERLSCPMSCFTAQSNPGT